MSDEASKLRERLQAECRSTMALTNELLDVKLELAAAKKQRDALLEALETLESMPDERSIHDISNEELAAWEKARNAIAKAKGLAHE